MIRYIDPLKDFGASLLGVEKPARYTGGEYGRLCGPALCKPGEKPAVCDSGLKTVIAFSDLYEIGMSNQALRILYNRLNSLDGISCDRAFAPAPDFEELLRGKGLPLYGLDSGISLKDTDLLMFTLGYELCMSGVFTMLDISGIPLRCRDRQENDPIVIMGGPCVSNPLPYAAFIDAFWIGEAEGGFFGLASELAEIKKQGGNRQALLERLLGHPSVWAKGKGRALRAIDTGFSVRGHDGEISPAIFPVASMKVVHQHGSVEIMRGCPNGCRFCHAGCWYRPMRQKSADTIEAETEAFIRLGGYREISLSSLSSGDYRHLGCLIERLNSRFGAQRVSFQLPSLRVSGFSLDLLEKVSEVRKSGLTFAIETPADFWQMALNKKVPEDEVVSILKEARKRGWKGAKFYFMVGLPLGSKGEAMAGLKPEEEEIAAFVERITRQTGMRFNINVGAFVPKPHTPFQWAGQLSREEAEKKLNYLRARLKPQGHKVGIQYPLLSVIEGIASRGDERAGELFEEAYRMGCRLDSWSEYLRKDIWESLIEKHKDLVDKILAGVGEDSSILLPWSCIDSGISQGHLTRELNKSHKGETTLRCIQNCTSPCGICQGGGSPELVQNNIQYEVNSQAAVSSIQISKKPDPAIHRILFSFSKQQSAIFQAHLSLLEIFSMAFVRAGIPVLYTQGFNPLPRLDIASPLSLGIRARGEIATIDMDGHFDAQTFRDNLNRFLPEGLAIEETINTLIPSGQKKYSVSSLLWGYTYAGNDGNTDIVKAKEEKAYRASRVGTSAGENVYGLERLSLLATMPQSRTEDLGNSGGQAQIGVSYFEVYRKLYPQQPFALELVK